MKVALVNPGVAAALKKENLGIAYLAATLEQTGHETRVIDENAGQDVERELAAFRPDVVGISCMTMYAERAYAIADAVRNKRGVPVILGGAHPTALPDEAIQHADCVIRGEAEWTLPKVLDSGRIEGVVEAVPPADLDALPFPARERLDLDFYAGAGEELAGLPYRTLGVI
nr:cobalamin-dependent protein [Candidatus Hydrogenedentota bacterium]